MRITVRHETRYTYRQPARSALQLLRLTPRPYDSQFVRRWRVEVDTDARLDKSEDAYGNITQLVFLEGPIEKVSIVVEGEVQTTDTGGIVRGAVERQPERLFLRETAATRPSPEIRRAAREAAASEGGDMLAALHRINHLVHQTMTVVPLGDSSATAGEIFSAKKGASQDLAHVLISASRVLGLPARCVTGYFMEAERTDTDAAHVWAEVHFPKLGWIGFDPVHEVCMTEQHIRVAIGPDYAEATPVRGSQVGGEDEDLAVEVELRQGRAIIEA